MGNERTIYDEIGVKPAINAAGTKTTFGGPLIREDAVEAMRAAANSSVQISELQGRASELIREATGAEAGVVTTGASSGLTLAAAACIAGNDPSIMEKLPNTDEIANEIIMPRVFRNPYDRALKASGAEIVDVGSCSRNFGMTPTNLEPWEVEAAITEDTVAISYLPKPHTDISLRMLVDVAHDNDLHVIVDAAGSLPPAENLTRFFELGADLVSFCGGKGIRGPQTTGFVAGKKELVQSAAVQILDMGEIESIWNPPSELIRKEELSGIPRNGIGRGFKVGKEELVGLIYALEKFIQEDEEALRKEWFERCSIIREGLSDIDGISTTIVDGATDIPDGIDIRADMLPSVKIEIDEAVTGITAKEVITNFREENPRILVKPTGIDKGEVPMTPFSISDSQAEYIIQCLSSYVGD